MEERLSGEQYQLGQPGVVILGVGDDGLYYPMSLSSNGGVGGHVVSASDSFTRPTGTTAYAALDAVTNSTGTTIPFILDFPCKPGASGYITKVRLITDLSTCTAQFRVWFYDQYNPIAGIPTLPKDNDPLALLWSNRTFRLGYIDLPSLSTEGTGTNSAQTMMSLGNNGAFAVTLPVGSNRLIAVLETIGTFTPVASQQFYMQVFLDVE